MAFQADELKVVEDWVAAERRLSEVMYHRIAADPVRIVVVLDGKAEIVELEKKFFDGRARVLARRVAAEVVHVRSQAA